MTPDSLGDRMKHYENLPRASLMPKVPVLIRVDGKAFHTLTRKCAKPFDQGFSECMAEAAIALCKGIQGAQLAFSFSDEISILVTDFASRETRGWFNYVLPKMISVAAATATAAFYKAYRLEFRDDASAPVFDARAWNLPAHEVCNYFIWRQQDAIRNSINALAQSYYSPSLLHGLSTERQLTLLYDVQKVRWEDRAHHKKYGFCVVRQEIVKQEPQPHTRFRWEVDEEIPLFQNDRAYIERFVRDPEKESA